jgi:hypothetical protein
MSLSISPNNANRLIIAFVTGSGEPFILRFCLIAMILTFFFMSCSTSKTNLRASDMLGIKVHQVKDLKPNDEIVLNEKKTKKERRITLNRACISAIRGLLASKKYTDEDFLFTGQRGVLTVPTVNQKVKSWYRTINLKGNFGGAYFEKNFRIPPTGFIRNRSANPDGNFQSQHSETDPILSLCSA